MTSPYLDKPIRSETEMRATMRATCLDCGGTGWVVKQTFSRNYWDKPTQIGEEDEPCYTCRP